MLVNNAGIAISGPVEVVPLDEWRRIVDVNLLGQVAVTRALLPAILRARGRVVNMSSIGGRVANPLFGPYSASKFALEAVSDALRREVAAARRARDQHRARRDRDADLGQGHRGRPADHGRDAGGGERGATRR